MHSKLDIDSPPCTSGINNKNILTIKVPETYYNVFHMEVPFKARSPLAWESPPYRYIDVILPRVYFTVAWSFYRIRKIAGCACTGSAGNVFSYYWLQWKPLVSDPGMHHDTCVMHVPWCMSGSLTRGGRENVPGIPGACATRNFTYLARGPLLADRCFLLDKKIMNKQSTERCGFSCMTHILYFIWSIYIYIHICILIYDSQITSLADVRIER